MRINSNNNTEGQQQRRGSIPSQQSTTTSNAQSAAAVQSVLNENLDFTPLKSVTTNDETNAYHTMKDANNNGSLINKRQCENATSTI